MVKIQKTKNYDMFKFLHGNRVLDNKRIGKLTGAIKDRDLLSVRPIVINEKNEIIDGQHRLEAAKKLGKPVYYIVGDAFTLEEVQVLNQNNRNWSAKEFLTSFVAKGNKNYTILKSFKEEFGFGIGECISLLSGKHRNYANFRDGGFEVTDWRKARKIARMVYDFAPFYTGYKRRTFIYAMQLLAGNKNYNHERMMTKSKYQKNKFEDKTSVEQYLEMLEKIYNFKTPTNKRKYLRTL